MRIAITTLGCKINQYDSAVIRERLEGGHSFVPFDERADFYIINSCTVTDRADWEARQLVRRARRASPDAKVLVTGCYAQVSPEQVARLPGVDFVVGLNRLDDLARFVEEARDGRTNGVKLAVADVARERGIPALGAREIPGHTRAFLKIQEGCNYSCTYCIIPTARGLSRSVPPQEILAQIRSLAERGFIEVVLTGIHLGGYGQDLQPKADLTSLLEEIAERQLIPRLRLSSLDPREVPERLLRLMAGSKTLCSHLHICAQAGEDGILKRMRRNYDTAYYRDVVTAARERLPDAALGSDIIVGFPGESAEDFARSLEYFDSLPLTYFHVFPYSVRSGTPAAGYEGQLATAEKKKRAARMRELGAKKKREFCRGFIGRRVPVLLEQAAGEAWRGRSRNYLPVLVRSGAAEANCEVDVAIEGLANGWLTGEIADEETIGESETRGLGEPEMR
jgi:threonylcarbamoyladenosine tRNA methylthiotransferase MtaB